MITEPAADIASRPTACNTTSSQHLIDVSAGGDCRPAPFFVATKDEAQRSPEALAKLDSLDGPTIIVEVC